MENQLSIIIKESGLESSKAKYILENFQNYFEIAAEWENKAKTLIVTKPDQKAEMEMARTGRLFLREKRIAIEKARKELKEQSLREGKAIDGIANVLKALIVPIEEYLDRQERFIEIEEEKKKEVVRIEVEKKMEEDRIAKEKAEAEERERIRLENERLKAEAIEREKRAAEERKKQDDALAAERAKTAAAEKKQREEKEKAETEKRAIEDKAKKEKEAQEQKIAEERQRAEAERKRLEDQLKKQVECPNCHHKFEPILKK